MQHFGLFLEIEYGIPESEVLDTNIWNKKYIKSVAREVYDRLQNLVRKTDTQQIRTLNNKRVSVAHKIDTICCLLWLGYLIIC